jgi:hypothetical protein
MKQLNFGKLIMDTYLPEEDHQVLIDEACTDQTNYAVLIQHLKGVNTLANIIKAKSFMQNDLVYILFQLYMTLSTISNEFTHNDLHWSNVLLYEPVENSYIEYNYHIKKKLITFKSKYIAKIIDYGRCSVKQQFIQEFIINKNFENCSGSDNINANINVSQDLRLLHIIQSRGYISRQMLPNVIFEGSYYTKEIKDSGYPDTINNVTDAYNVLKDIVSRQDMIDANSGFYIGKTKLGDLHIYDDGGNMEYVPFLLHRLAIHYSP